MIATDSPMTSLTRAQSVRIISIVCADVIRGDPRIAGICRRYGKRLVGRVMTEGKSHPTPIASKLRTDKNRPVMIDLFDSHGLLQTDLFGNMSGVKKEAHASTDIM